MAACIVRLVGEVAAVDAGEVAGDARPQPGVGAGGVPAETFEELMADGWVDAGSGVAELDGHVVVSRRHGDADGWDAVTGGVEQQVPH